MRITRPIRSATAICLLALLSALGSGMPTHSHPGSERTPDSEAHGITADHHAHGTELIDQTDRAPSGLLQVAALSAVTVEALPAMDTAIHTPSAATPRPMERAPPPCAPRPPPAVV